MGEGLTDKQAAFVREYCVDWNGTQAAIRAGYSAKTAQEQSSRLLSKAIVQAAVAEARAAAVEKNAVTVDEILGGLREIAFPPEQKGVQVSTIWPRDRLKALELLGRHLGIFIDRKEHSGPKGKPIEVTQKTWLEVMEDESEPAE